MEHNFVPRRGNATQSPTIPLKYDTVHVPETDASLIRHSAHINHDRAERQQNQLLIAENVTLVATSPCEIPIVKDALIRYILASGAKLNFTKSTALALALDACDTSIRITESSYHTDTKILGFDITSTVNARQK
jgi:hypothetical protein